MLLGAVAFIGCAADDHAIPASEKSSTAGGNGAFGENPARPGDYNTGNNPGRDVSPSRDYAPSGSNNATAGGNGAFGENPARPGDYEKSAPSTNPAN